MSTETTVTQINAPAGTIEEPLSVSEHMVNFGRAINTIDEEIQVFKDHRSALKKDYKDNGWLNAKQQAAVIKTLHMLKKAETLEDLEAAFDALEEATRLV